MVESKNLYAQHCLLETNRDAERALLFKRKLLFEMKRNGNQMKNKRKKIYHKNDTQYVEKQMKANWKE